jgi:GH25 family lysozyme M1 (1,4-beta-N-acetylmuramidase)
MKRIDMVDVSSCQGTNFTFQALVEQSKIDVAYIRATHGTSSASANYFWRDSMFYKNWDNALACGVNRGAYIVSDPSGDPIAQAHGAMETIGILSPADLPPAVDFEMFPEPPKSLRGAELKAWYVREATKLAKWLVSHVSELRRISGRKPLIYMGGMTYLNYVAIPELSEYMLWLAQYLDNVRMIHPSFSTWSIWQYLGDTAPHLPGYNVAIDLNTFKDGKEATLDRLYAQTEGPQLFEFRNTLGVQRVLAQLGFNIGAIDDKMGPRTISAIEQFQRVRSIPVTGKVDDVTKAELNQAVAAHTNIPPVLDDVYFNTDKAAEFLSEEELMCTVPTCTAGSAGLAQYMELCNE